jgi:hypothetical protein
MAKQLRESWEREKSRLREVSSPAAATNETLKAQVERKMLETAAKLLAEASTSRERGQSIQAAAAALRMTPEGETGEAAQNVEVMIVEHEGTDDEDELEAEPTKADDAAARSQAH